MGFLKIHEYPLLRLLLPMLGGILFSELTLYTILNTNTLLFLIIVLILLLIILQYLSKKSSLFISGFGVVVPLLSFLIGCFNTLLHAPKSSVGYKIEYHLATIQSDPIFKPENNTFQYDVEIHDSLINFKVKVFQRVENDSISLQYGDLILISGSITKPESVSNSYVFDYGKYLRRNGYEGTLFLNKTAYPILLESYYKKGIIPNLRYLRLRMKNIVLDSSLSSDSKALVIALLFGSKEFIHDKMKNSFSAVGVSHVLALSGLHVGFIYSVLSLFIGLFFFYSKNRRRYSLIIGIFILWLFALFTGASPSVIRATLFFTIYAFGYLLKRRIYGVQVLINTAFIMLLINPYWLFDLGFQFSFCAVLSIIKFAPIINKLYTPKSLIGHYIYNLCNMSISAQLGTLPLILYYFGYFPLYFLFANLIVIPLITSILYLSIGFIALETVVPQLNVIKGILDFLSLCLVRTVDWLALNTSPSRNQYIGVFSFIVIYVILIQVYYLLKKVSFQRIICFQLSCVMLLFPSVLKNYNDKNGVYISAINGNLLIHQINQSTGSIVSSTPHLTFGKIDSTFHQYWIVNGFKPPKRVCYSPCHDKDIYVEDEIIFLQSGESIYVPKKNKRFNLEVDYVYLNNRNINSCNLKDLKFKTLICHNNISSNLKNELKLFSKAKNIEIIDLQDKAYLTLLP